jgi:hypothetical protein
MGPPPLSAVVQVRPFSRACTKALLGQKDGGPQRRVDVRAFSYFDELTRQADEPVAVAASDFNVPVAVGSPKPLK